MLRQNDYEVRTRRYVKISTSNEGKIKVIDGTPETYKAGYNEKAQMIFRRYDND